MSSESLSSNSVPSAKEMRRRLQSASDTLAWQTWLRWVDLKAGERSRAEQGQVVSVMNDTLRYGAAVVEHLGISPKDACKASLEARTGRPAILDESIDGIIHGYMTSIAGPEDDTKATEHAEAEIDYPTDAESPVPSDLSGIIAPLDARASGLITMSTKDLQELLADMEKGQEVPAERSALVFGNYFNALGHTGLILFNRHMSDELQLVTLDGVE